MALQSQIMKRAQRFDRLVALAGLAGSWAPMCDLSGGLAHTGN